MCGGPERLKPQEKSQLCSSATPAGASVPTMANSRLTVEVSGGGAFSSLLELAANNDNDAFRQSLERDPSAADEVGLWYGRRKGSSGMVLEHRTPLMVAATYGSLDVLRVILSLGVDVNRASGLDGTTALHCAASGGSSNAADAVRLLLSAGADTNAVDASGLRPADVILVPPKVVDVKNALEELLGKISSDEDLSPSSEFPDLLPPPLQLGASEKREYPVDPSLPDIKNSIYATDEFRMFSFKVRPCSRAYSHDWTECPFVHPGENARRRDPRKYHYSCVPCPDFRKGSCRRGDMCEYAHGVFECWLHPAQYRTRLCKDGTSCSRRVCFFAHTHEELRPLYVSTGSAVPSPRSSTASALELATAMGLMPGSPSSVSGLMSPFTPPISPNANGIGHPSLAWPQPNVPALHLPGSNLQSSRLRSSLSVRDMPVDDFSMLPELEQQMLNDLFISRLSSSAAGNRSIRTKVLNPANLDDLFSAEMASSPRYNSDQGAMFSPSHKAAILNQFQQQHQNLLTPINTNVLSPKTLDSQHSSLLQASLGLSSPVRMSSMNVEPVSPMRLAMIAQQQQQHREMQQQTLRSLSSRDFGSNPLSSVAGSPLSSSWSKWVSPTGQQPDWGVKGEDISHIRRSSSFDLRANAENPDLSWVHTLVKEPTPEKSAPTPVYSSVASATAAGDSSNSRLLQEDHDQAAVLGAWLEQMQIDQMVFVSNNNFTYFATTTFNVDPFFEGCGGVGDLTDEDERTPPYEVELKVDLENIE